MVTRGGGGQDLNEGDEKVQTFSYETNEFYRSHAQHERDN